MSERLDPQVLFDLIAFHVPKDLHANLLIVGSLAAAYHHRAKMKTERINTKDADVIVQPAGAVDECRKIAGRLLADGWRRTSKCFSKPTPDGDLQAIRLHPPNSDAYFIELLAFPEVDQAVAKDWVPCELDDGWYGLPSFRFMGLTKYGSLRAGNGLAFAAPEMMALSNLLSHERIGVARVGEPIEGRKVLRAAKDLGRVLALSRLASREEVEAWPERWMAALRDRFPGEAKGLAARAGSGLAALLADRSALEDARHSVDVGLLAGVGVTLDQLEALGAQFTKDALEPLARLA